MCYFVSKNKLFNGSKTLKHVATVSRELSHGHFQYKKKIKIKQLAGHA